MTRTGTNPHGPVAAIILVVLAFSCATACRRYDPPSPTPTATLPPERLLSDEFARPRSAPTAATPQTESVPAEGEPEGPLPPDCEDYVQLQMTHWENKQADYEASGLPFAVPSPDLERLRQGWRRTAAKVGERTAASRCRTQLMRLAEHMH